MKFEDFNAGTLVQQYQYKSFLPIAVNRAIFEHIQWLVQTLHTETYM